MPTKAYSVIAMEDFFFSYASAVNGGWSERMDLAEECSKAFPTNANPEVIASPEQGTTLKKNLSVYFNSDLAQLRHADLYKPPQF
jgi:hypothetical protein